VTRARGHDLLPRLGAADPFALAAFNVSNLETGQAVIAAAEEASAPVIMQISPGAIAYAGYGALTRLAFDLAEHAAVPVLVHLDHCREEDLVRRAIDDGYGSVMFDGSRLPLADNIAILARLVERARAAAVTVEGELGIIGGIEDSTILDAVAARTSPEQAARFVAATGIDILAPAIGTLHRMPDDSVSLDADYLAAVAAAANRPLALHGGSGVRRADLGPAIRAGVRKVNISSRVTRALAGGIRAAWTDEPDMLDLRQFLGAGRDAVRAMAADYLVLTGSAGRTAAVASASAWSGTLVEPE
jgi:ketose-bisphosphate aldolase